MMETQKQTRTIKRKFIWADKTGRFIKGAGGYLGAFVGGLFSSQIIDQASKNEDDEDSEDS